MDATNLIHLADNYLPIYLLILLCLKALGVIFPPIPGAIFTLVSIPVIGWKLAYLIDLLGSTIGVCVAFYLGKKFGYTLLYRFVGTKITNKISKIKLKQNNQIESAIFLRFATGGLLSDGLAWGGGLIGFSFVPLLIGFTVAHLVLTLPIFYLVAFSISLNSGYIIAITAILAWLVILKFKGRYFE